MALVEVIQISPSMWHFMLKKKRREFPDGLKTWVAVSRVTSVPGEGAGQDSLCVSVPSCSGPRRGETFAHLVFKHSVSY